MRSRCVSQFMEGAGELVVVMTGHLEQLSHALATMDETDLSGFHAKRPGDGDDDGLVGRTLHGAFGDPHREAAGLAPTHLRNAGSGLDVVGEAHETVSSAGAHMSSRPGSLLRRRQLPAGQVLMDHLGGRWWSAGEWRPSRTR